MLYSHTQTFNTLNLNHPINLGGIVGKKNKKETTLILYICPQFPMENSPLFFPFCLLALQTRGRHTYYGFSSTVLFFCQLEQCQNLRVHADQNFFFLRVHVFAGRDPLTDRSGCGASCTTAHVKWAGHQVPSASCSAIRR